MKYKNKVRLNDFLSCLDPSTVVKIFIIDPDNRTLEEFIHSKVMFISFKFIGNYYVQSASLVNELPFTNPDFHISVMPDDLPF